MDTIYINSQIIQIVYRYIVDLVHNIISVSEKPNRIMSGSNCEQLLLRRNASSPYTELETKTIREKNFIINDETRKSRLGKSVTFSCPPDIKLVENTNFCSFICKWVPLN